MKINKKKFFNLHRWVGIKLSIIFFIVCFSGTMATLSHEMDWLFFPAHRAVPSDTYASKNEAAKNIQQAFPNGRIGYWAAQSEPYTTDMVQVLEKGQRYYVFLNPYTGQVQGKATLTFQRFFRDLHYYLFIPFQLGHFIVLAFGFLLLISTLTAFLFYKKWYKKLFELKIGKGRVAFFRSLHRLVGLWSVPFTILFSITGIWYFVERTNTAQVHKTANMKSPKLQHNIPDSMTFEGLNYNIDYDAAIAKAKEVIPGFKIKDILPPRKANNALYLNGKTNVKLVRNRANRVYLHPTTFEVLALQKADEIGAVTWFNDIADPLHFGYWGGLVTKIIWFIGGAAISSLVLSGVWVSYKRIVRNRKQKKKQRMAGWKYVNWVVYVLMLVFMLMKLITQQNAPPVLVGILAVVFLACGFLAWYIFDYRINKSLQLEKKQT